MSFERQQPSVELRAFLDPLKPGSYFDCGGARLHGIDEALEAEAVRRGRDVGGDDFQLVATDGGLIFCRASISFAIAARWKDLSIGRPVNGETGGKVLLPIYWPTHGDLEFTVSRRLGSNVFRRWLQIQAQATRRSQLEQGGDDQQHHSMVTTEVHGVSSSATVDEMPGVEFGAGDTIDLRDDTRMAPDPQPFPGVGVVHDVGDGPELDRRQFTSPYHGNDVDPAGEYADEGVEVNGHEINAYNGHAELDGGSQRIDELDGLSSEPLTSSEPPTSSAPVHPAGDDDVVIETAGPNFEPHEIGSTDTAHDGTVADVGWAFPTQNQPAEVKSNLDDFVGPEPVADVPGLIDLDEIPAEEPWSELSAPEPPPEVSSQEVSLDVSPQDVPLDVSPPASEGDIKAVLDSSGSAQNSEASGWSDIDEELLDSWVDDRQLSPDDPRRHRARHGMGDEDPTSNPFEALRAESSLSFNRLDERAEWDRRPGSKAVESPKNDPVGGSATGLSPDLRSRSTRFEAGRARPRKLDSVPDQPNVPFSPDPVDEHPDDPSATHFMPRTLAGTEVFPSDGAGDRLDHSVDQLDDAGPQRMGARRKVPVPEIQGARLQQSPANNREPRNLDVRSSLLSGTQDSPLVQLFREWRLPILALASVLAIILLVIIGIVAGGGDSGETSATDSETADAVNGSDPQDEAGPDAASASPDATSASAPDSPDPVPTTTTSVVEQSALIVSTSSVQICHSNYGGCVPVAADVDCEGDGDGPAFQADPVAVFGDDVYDLDTDDDRQACEPDQPASSSTTGDG